MANREFTSEEVQEMTMKEYRKNLPSGWMELTRYESLVLMIDALAASPTSREFTTKELAKKAGITSKSVEKHIGLLDNLGVVKKLSEDRDEVRYSLNERSPITQKIFELNRTVEGVKANDLPKSIPERPTTQRLETNVVPIESATANTSTTTQKKTLRYSEAV